MNTEKFGHLLCGFGFDRFVGVPCSFLSPLINYAINEDCFIMANNEGDAVAIASGITLSHQNQYGVVLMQNSGLSNALSPLTSLNYVFQIPILGFVSLRGECDEYGRNTDEPQHELMGKITESMLQTCKINYVYLSDSIEIAQQQIFEAKGYLDNGRSFFFIVKKDTLDPLDLIEKESKLLSQRESYCTRLQALEIIAKVASEYNVALFATTGKTGRELYEIGDQENQFYMVGSMGCVSAIGLGVALCRKKVFCIDGDGALLMRAGVMSTNAYYSKVLNQGNFCHILLDNQMHDSTGGQFTLSPYVDFVLLAKSFGYDSVIKVSSPDELYQVLLDVIEKQSGGATFIYMSICGGSKKGLGRPKVTPTEVANRMKIFLK